MIKVLVVCLALHTVGYFLRHILEATMVKLRISRITADRVVRLGAIIVMFSASAFAQTTASLRGSVQDQSGAGIPRVSLTAISERTGRERSTVSEDDGTYAISSLPVGEYQLRIAKEGFKTAQLSGIALQVDQVVEINIKLEAGNIQEQVLISTQAPLVDTSTPTLGQEIDNKRIVDLPLNGRKFLQLAELSPGITVDPDGSIGQGLGGVNGPRITSNGAREDMNNFTLDGVQIADPFYNTLSVSPPIDSIQEFKVEQSLYSVQSGPHAGAQINIVTKSGSNNFHGSLYEFVRNDLFDARNFFDAKKPPFHQNQYGVSVGGPIIRNRTFFFGNWEGLRIRQGITVGATVPTLAERQGDLSELGGTIVNPFTGQPFPNNVVPSGLIDPASVAILAVLPAPNNNDPARNLISTPLLRNNTDQFVIRFDHRLTSKDTVFGRFAFSDLTELQPFGPPASQLTAGAVGGVPGFGINLTSNARNLAINWTRIFSPTMVGEFRFGYNRIYGGQGPQNAGNDFGQKFNIAKVTQAGPQSGYPSFSTGIFSTFGDQGLLLARAYSNHQIGGSMSWTHGVHTVKFGGNLDFDKMNPFLDFFTRGNFLYFGSFTGNPFADFLLGLPGFALNGISATGGGTSGKFRGRPAAFFVQDDWHVSSRLTLNLGLRWDYFGNYSEDNNRLANFIHTPNGGAFVLASSGGTVNTADQIPGSQANLSKFVPFITSEEAGLPRSLYHTPKANFAPRIGLAFDVFGNQKTVLRAGSGIYYEPTTLNTLAIVLFSPPFFNLGQLPSFLLPASQASIHTVLNNIQPGQLAFAEPRNPDTKDQYLYQWNLSIQQQLTPSLMLSAAYVGTKATHLFESDFSFNYAAPGDPTTVQQRVPFPFLGPTSWINNIQNSNYNALHLHAEQRLWKGVTYNVNYTFGKSLDTDSLGQVLANGSLHQDPTNFRLDYGRSAFDVKHNFVANFIYALPFSAASHWKKMVEGWQVTGILALRTGPPFTVNLNSDRVGTGRTDTGRPDLVGNPNLPSSQRTPNHWFNTSAFVLQPVGQPGTAGRNILDAAGYKNFDFSILKDTKIRESLNVQLRAEFFNIFNFANFGYPNGQFVPAGFISSAPAGAPNVNPSFGTIFNAKAPRIIQFGVKLIF
jgi:hypothetical protein